MALILCIDTSTETGSIALSKDGIILGKKINSNQKDHAGWIHLAIKELLSEQKMTISSLEAIAIASGPGSYTGLRVAMATAKGLCYALKIPLITINTLRMLANGILMDNSANLSPDDLICPMIDARRMEVFTALYSSRLEELQEPLAMILDNDSFKKELEGSRIIFTGNGAHKFKNIISHSNAVFEVDIIDVSALASLAEISFQQQIFEDLAYAAPVYVKGFFDTRKK